MSDNNHIVTLGKLGKVYGFKGWMRLYSFTTPHDNIFSYTPWLIKQLDTWQPCVLDDYRKHNKDWIVRINDCEDCNEANRYVNALIGVDKTQLPACDDSEVYWHDLMGLTVINQNQITLGIVTDIFETGANPVLIIRDENDSEQLVPYVDHVIVNIDLSKRTICIDWDF